MSDEQKPALVALRDRREAVIVVLENGYAADLLDDSAFEERIARAHAAVDIVTLDTLVADLEATTRVALVPTRPAVQLVPVSSKILAVFSSLERRGAFALPQALTVRAIFGSTVLDLRDAQLLPGETVLTVYATFSNIEITVPPELTVVSDIAAIMSSVEHKGHGAVIDPDRPVLRIVGRAVFGSVEIRVRPRGRVKGALAQLAEVGRKLLGS